MSLFEKLGRRPPTQEEWNQARQEALDEAEEAAGAAHTALFRAQAARIEGHPERVRELLTDLEALLRYGRAQLSNINDSLKPGASLESFTEAVRQDKEDRRPTR